MAKEKVGQQKARLVREQKAAQAQAQQAQQQPAPQQQYQPQPQQAPQRDPKLERWLEKNKWFGSDRLMTRAAQAIHEQLVLEEDFDPTF